MVAVLKELSELFLTFFLDIKLIDFARVVAHLNMNWVTPSPLQLVAAAPSTTTLAATAAVTGFEKAAECDDVCFDTQKTTAHIGVE